MPPHTSVTDAVASEPAPPNERGRFRAALASGPALLSTLFVGILVGSAVGLVADAGAARTTVYAVAGAMAVLVAGGLTRLVTSGVVAIAVTAALLEVVVSLFTHTSVPLVVVILLFGLAGAASLTMLPRGSSGRHVDLVDLFTAGLALLIAVGFHRAFPSVPRAGFLTYLLHGEDNAAWVNIARLMHSHGGFGGTVSLDSMHVQGPVVSTFLSLTMPVVPRDASAAGFSVHTVLVAYGLIAILVPLACRAVAGYVAGGIGQLTQIVTVLAATSTLIALAKVSMSYGFLSALLAGVMTTLAAGLAARYAREKQAPPHELYVAMLAGYAAMAAWFPLVPAGAAGLGALALLGAFRHGRFKPGARLRSAAPLILATGLVGCAALQMSQVVDSVGGQSGTLLTAGGATPQASSALMAFASVLTALGCVVALVRRDRFTALMGTFPALLLLGYATAVRLWELTTTGTSHYGSTKLIYEAAHVLPVLALWTLVSLVRKPLTALLVAAGVAAATVVATVHEHEINPPDYRGMLQRARSVAYWVPPTSEFRTADVVCLDVTSRSPGPANLPAYFCTRWASSLNGSDDALSRKWAQATLGMAPPESVTALLAARPAGHHVTVLVIGNQSRLHDPAAWWAPILSMNDIDTAPVR